MKQHWLVLAGLGLIRLVQAVECMVEEEQDVNMAAFVIWASNAAAAAVPLTMAAQALVCSVEVVNKRFHGSPLSSTAACQGQGLPTVHAG